MGWLVVGSTACWVVSKPEKSPPSSPAVGTLLKRVNPLLDRKPSQYPEKYVFESRPLYRPQGVGKITGPPTVRPYWFWRKAGFFCFAKLSKKFAASNLSFRRNSQRSPCISLLPDLVTTLTLAPDEMLNC